MSIVQPERTRPSHSRPAGGNIYFIDRDEAYLQSFSAYLERSGYRVWSFDTAPEFLEIAAKTEAGCVIADIGMPEREGIALLAELKRRRLRFPTILSASHPNVATAMEAIHAGAVDFVEKPFTEDAIASALGRAFAELDQTRRQGDTARIASQRLGLLTFREREVLQGLIAGKTNRDIAGELAISVRTVEFYRGRIMRKMHARGVSELVQLALAAGLGSDLQAIPSERRYNG